MKSAIHQESSIEGRIDGALPHSNWSSSFKKTSQAPMQSLFRRRSLSSNDASMVVDVPEVLSCSSSDSDTSASTLPSLDFTGEALHKRYYNACSISKPKVAPTVCTELPLHQQDPSVCCVHPQKELMKRRRRDKTATLGMVGAGVGTLILPVIGTVVGGVLTGYAVNQSLKRHEKKIQRKWERDQFQKNASASQAARHAVFA